VTRTGALRFSSACLTVLLAQLASARALTAQAWVPAKGEGTVTETYQNYYHTGHFDRLGRKNENGATHSKTLITQIDVGITDTFALSLSLPFIASKYTGPDYYEVEGIPTTPGPLDRDRTYHGAFQDLHVEARRMFEIRAAAVAPFVGFSQPTHDYETAGEAVPGRHRREFQVGAAASMDLDRWLPRSSIHGRYGYAALERVNNFPHTRSNIDVEGNHDVTSRVGMRGLIGWQIAHKRPTLAQLAPDWVHHDRFINSSYLNVGGGAFLSVTRTTEIFAIWASTVRGNRGAHVGRMLAVGVGRSFGGGLHGLGR
jgi:hypothetical protein